MNGKFRRAEKRKDVKRPKRGYVSREDVDDEFDSDDSYTFRDVDRHHLDDGNSGESRILRNSKGVGRMSTMRAIELALDELALQRELADFPCSRMRH